jgi:hypothetical protein
LWPPPITMTSYFLAMDDAGDSTVRRMNTGAEVFYRRRSGVTRENAGVADWGSGCWGA